MVEGFFGAEGKKDQFPDAFIFEALKALVLDGSDVIVVSGDPDFKKPCAETDGFERVDSIKSLFSRLGYEFTAPNIYDFICTHNDEIINYLNSEIQNYHMMVVDIEDAEIYEVEIESFETEKISAFKIARSESEILVIGVLNVEAGVEFEHPDWETASYDSEDKVLLPFQSVSGFRHISFRVPIEMSVTCDVEAEPVRISDFNISDDFNGSVFLDTPEELK